MMKSKVWEVGSTWYIAPSKYIPESKEEIYIPAISGNVTDISFLSTCRSAIGMALDMSSGKQGVAFVPAFTCHTVILPFLERNFKIYAYPINDNLSIDWDGFEKLYIGKQPSVVLFHSYFGFNTMHGGDTILHRLHSDCVTIIEDLTQTMFSTYEHLNADFFLGSIRKWMPVPDGAFINCRVVKDLREDTELANAKITAMRDKGNYIMNGIGEKDVFMAEFKAAEELLESRKMPFLISDAAVSIYNDCDIKEFSLVRRNNYKILATRLKKHSRIKVIFEQLPEDVVPFMFPVLMKEGRKNFQQYMASHNVYPTVIWACPNELKDLVDAKANNIYDNILCFHCDQRYSTKDMEIVADIVDSYFIQGYGK